MRPRRMRPRPRSTKSWVRPDDRRRQLDGCGSLPQKANFTTLPWSKTIVAEMPGIFAYVIAQGDGPSIGCRITVDGKLVDQQEANTRDAQVSCLDKSA